MKTEGKSRTENGELRTEASRATLRLHCLSFSVLGSPFSVLHLPSVFIRVYPWLLPFSVPLRGSPCLRGSLLPSFVPLCGPSCLCGSLLLVRLQRVKHEAAEEL